MAWSQALAAPQGKEKSQVAASVWTRKVGDRLRIIIKRNLYSELGGPKCANAWLGDGDEAGQVLVQFDQDGDLPARTVPKGGQCCTFSFPAE